MAGAWHRAQRSVTMGPRTIRPVGGGARFQPRERPPQRRCLAAITFRRGFQPGRRWLCRRMRANLTESGDRGVAGGLRPRLAAGRFARLGPGPGRPRGPVVRGEEGHPT